MILEPKPGQRVLYTDQDKVGSIDSSGPGVIKVVHGPLFVTLKMDSGPDIGAYTSELTHLQQGTKP